MPLEKSITDDFKEVKNLFQMQKPTAENAAVAQHAGEVQRVIHPQLYAFNSIQVGRRRIDHKRFPNRSRLARQRML